MKNLKLLKYMKLHTCLYELQTLAFNTEESQDGNKYILLWWL